MSARSPLFAVALLLVAMTSIQTSASLAKTLFLRLDPVGVTTLRLIFAALVLLLVLRPWRNFRREALGSLLGYGVAMGVMNLTIYLAMQRLPIGIAVGLEFVGPMGVALCALRRWLDLLWSVLVVGGLASRRWIHWAPPWPWAPVPAGRCTSCWASAQGRCTAPAR